MNDNEQPFPNSTGTFYRTAMSRKPRCHVKLPSPTSSSVFMSNHTNSSCSKTSTNDNHSHTKAQQQHQALKASFDMTMHVSNSVVTGVPPRYKKKAMVVGAYELMETLGRGNFGKVRRAVHFKSGVEYAIKVVETSMFKQDLPGNLDIRREMSILRALSHPNIIHLHDVMVSANRVYMVMDLATGGDFFKLISNHGRLSETEGRKYFRQLVDAVDYCHQRGIYHRDLKPENLLLTEDGTLKVTDFGFSAMKDHGRMLLQTNCGSPHYCAPEVWNGSQNGYEGAKSDAFSVGVVLFVLLCGGQPFYDNNEDRLLQKVNRCKVQYPEWLSGDAVDLLKKLIVRDPRKRWSLAMARRHPWFLAGSLDSLVVERMSECGEGVEEWERCKACCERGCFAMRAY